VRDPSHPAHREHSINGRLLAACGAGRSLSAAKMTDQDVTESVRQLTTDPGYGEAARAVAAEIAAQPSPAEVVPVLEELAAG
jgi:L-demethylnoviosyl transferase